MASLWKVDDAATQALMVEFYRNLWQEKLGTLDALRRAQSRDAPAVRPEVRLPPRRGRAVAVPGRRRGLPPYYWAAFTLAGDWR